MALRKIILFIALTGWAMLWSLNSFGQTSVYSHRYFFTDSLLATCNSGSVFLGKEKLKSDAVYTIKDDKIYKGSITNTAYLKYTFRDGKLYRGDGTMRKDIAFTIENGRIYTGHSTSPQKCLFTYIGSDAIVYKGNKTTALHEKLYLKGDLLDRIKLFALLLALDLL